jgi:putative peptidoglycan lipid II flippase
VSLFPRGLLKDTGIVSGLTLLAKLFGVAKAAAIARAFGSGHDLDSYLLAFLVPSFLADVFCGAIVPAAVPQFVELTHRRDMAQAHSFYANVLRDSLKLALLVSALCAIGAAVGLLATSPTHGVRLVSVLLLAMIPIIPCAAAANVWRAVLNARNIFAAPAFTTALAPLCIVAVVLAAAGTGGVWALALGTTLASVVEVAVLGWSIRLAGFPLWPRPADLHPPLAAVRREYVYLAATAAVGGGTLFLGQFMASSLGSGSVSILNYGTRLAAVLLALGPAALNVTILPRFSQLVAEGDWIVLRRALIGVLGVSLKIGALIAMVLFYFSAAIVRLTLQRGAFTAPDTDAVAAVQAISLLQVPFLIGITILVRALSAMKANRVLLPIFSAALVLNTALGYLLMQRYGVSGIALASCIGQATLFFVLVGVVFRGGRMRFPTER